jgi:hypothetical protein
VKRVTMLFLTVLFILSGCSSDRPSGTVEYIKKTVKHYNVVTHFINNVDALAAEAAKNPKEKERLEKKITDLKADIETFNDLIPPEVKQASSIHENLVKQNQTVAKGLDAYHNQVKKGNFDTKVIHTDEIKQAVQEMGKLRDQAQTLARY